MLFKLLKEVWSIFEDDDCPLGISLAIPTIVLSTLFFFITSFTCKWLDLEPWVTNSQWFNLTAIVSSALFIYPLTSTIILTPFIIIEWTFKLIYNTMKNNVFKLE